MVLSNDFVSKWYEMNPGDEDLLFSGKYLLDNMIVLMGDPLCRVEVTQELSEEDLEYAKRYNRWAQITSVSFVSDYVEFLAHYADGTKKKIATNVRRPWLVKLNSLPPRPQTLMDAIDSGQRQPQGYNALEASGAITTTRVDDETAVFQFRGNGDPESWLGELAEGDQHGRRRA